MEKAVIIGSGCAGWTAALYTARAQLVAVHTFGKAGEIFDDAGGGEQAAGLLAGENERGDLQPRDNAARSVGTT